MIVLPMAGESSRFRDAGYERPKYLLPLWGQTVMWHVLDGFSALFDRERFLIVCRDDDTVEEFLHRECDSVGLPWSRVDIVRLSRATAGQAETVARGLDGTSVDPDESLTIFNIDTFRPGFTFPESLDLNRIDGYLEVFHGAGDQWSFVRADPAGGDRSIEVTEKIRISDLCCTGLYYFASVRMFRDLFAEVSDVDPSRLQGGERYVAPLYNIAIQRDADIRFVVVTPEDVVFCGTPVEYEALLAGSPAEPR